VFLVPETLGTLSTVARVRVDEKKMKGKSCNKVFRHGTGTNISNLPRARYL
jgi:hypothetical protein